MNNRKEKISCNWNILIISSLKNNIIIDVKIAITKVMNKDNLAKLLAFSYFLGRTIEIGYVKAAIGIIIFVKAIIVPIIQKDSRPFSNVTTDNISIVFIFSYSTT